MVGLALEELKPFEGESEGDESDFGARRVRGKRGRGASGKTPVLGLHKRGDRVFVSGVQNCSKQALMPILRGHVLEESDVYTDAWKADDGLVTNGRKHHRVHHHRNAFARGKNHVNGIESFWSFAKLRMAKPGGCSGTSSCCTSGNVNGAGIIAATTFTRSSSPFAENIPSKEPLI